MACHDHDATARGLIAFAKAWDGLRAREASGPANRLLAFIQRYRALGPRRQQPAPDPRRPGLENRLPATLALLAQPLAEARASGAGANLWTVAGLRRDEVRTAAVLCWLLDPRGSHGRGAAFAEALWSTAACGSLGFTLSGLRRANTEVCPLGDQSNRIDIALEGDDFLVFIEVKIDAGLQPNQLQRYAAAAKSTATLRGKTHSAVLYLAPWKPAPGSDCPSATWREVARAIRLACPSNAQTFIDQAALQFAAHVEKLH